MWCPEGYLRWDELRTLCVSRTREFFFERKPTGDTEQSADTSNSEFLRVFRLGLATGRSLMVEALQKNVLSGCSPDGICLRIDARCLLHAGLWGRAYDIDGELIDYGRDWSPHLIERDPPKIWLEPNLGPKPTFLTGKLV